MELTRKTKNIIEKEYAEELRTAKVGYFREVKMKATIYASRAVQGY